MGVFDKIGEATFSEGGNYFRPGAYDLEIVKVKQDQTRKNHDFVAVDCKILGTTSDMHIGEIGNWFTSNQHDSFLGNVKQFCYALLSSSGSVDANSITPEIVESICKDNGAAVVGSRIRLQVTQVSTQKGGTFSRHTWLPAGATV